MTAPKLEVVPPGEPVELVITPIKFQTLELPLIGLSEYVQHRFSEKTQREMELKQREGEQPSKKKRHAKKDFEADFRAAMHVSNEGWPGIPAAAFRNACISACRISGFVMARAKLSVFIEPDGFDMVDGTPLVKIEGEPEMFIYPVRYGNTVDLASRPRWIKWGVEGLRIEFDGDQFKAVDILNLVNRAGQQVGIGEGRPDSPRSDGLGWGRFRVRTEER